MATYTIRNTSVQDWRDTAMSKAQFNALAVERRANRAGSGAEEMGKGNATTTLNVNEGVHTSATAQNTFYLGKVGGSGTSKTDHYVGYINGSIVACKYLNTTTADAALLLAPAPTVLPYNATLTTEQISTGVIKHADASNSGLIVNGKFDTDTSGWTASANTALSIDTNRLKILSSSTYGRAYQSVTTVVGKKYALELDILIGTSNSVSVWVGTSSSDNSLYVSPIYTIDGRRVIEFTATTAISYIQVIPFGNGIYCFIDNIAVYPADAISRSDLVFLETWHEDVSEKDFVYPLGNVQYLGGVTDGMGAIVSGAFGGSGTYSLFGNWQASSALVGKGYVWSTMTDTQKKAFVANPENNCYLDGDKVIQVRYRMRVVMGWGDSWDNTTVDISSTAPNKMLRYTGEAYVIAKGKLTSVSDIGAPSTVNARYIGKTTYFDRSTDYGAFFASYEFYGNTNDNPLAVAYEGKCFALPVALVHRRNQGAYHPVYNANGTSGRWYSDGSVLAWDNGLLPPIVSISDCFNFAPASLVQIGKIPSGIYGAFISSVPNCVRRPDGLFYDQVSAVDFKPSNKGADLRNTTKKRTAQNLIEEFAPKVIAGTLLYNNNDTTALTTYKDHMEVRDTSGNRYPMKNKVGNVVTINDTVANKKGFSIVVQNGKQYLQVADDAASDATVQMNLSVTKYDLGVFDE